MNNVKENYVYTNVAFAKQAKARELPCQSVQDNDGRLRVTGVLRSGGTGRGNES